MKKIILLLLVVSHLSYGADFSVQFSPEDNSVSTVKIQDGAVTASKIANESIDDSKVSFISSSKISDLSSSVTPNMAVGSIQEFAGASCPSGWLETNGQPLIKTEYSNLYGQIGEQFGGNPLTFNLPKKFSNSSWKSLASNANTFVTGLGGNVNFGTTSVNKARYRYDDERMELEWDLAIITGGSGNSGSASLINIPSSLCIIDTSEHVPSTSTIASSGLFHTSRVGEVHISYPSNNEIGVGPVVPYDANRLKYVYGYDGTNSGFAVVGAPIQYSLNNYSVTLKAKFKCTNRSASQTGLIMCIKAQ